MANPQRENGHIDIANEVAEYLAYYRLSGQEYQILWVIWRKTWGWQKKEDWISLSQFFLLTKMKKPSIIKIIKKLIDKNVISKKANGNTVLYRFNKDFDTWKSLAKRLIVSQKANGVSQKANGVSQKANGVSQKANGVSQKATHKRNYTKDNITKETIQKTILQAKPAEEIIPDLINDKQKHIQIIGLWARAKKINFTGKAHQQSFIRRNLRAAQNLVPYDIDRIMETMAYLIKNADFKSTLESVGKFIDEDLVKLYNKNKTIII